MSSNVTERGVAEALGSIKKVHTNTSISQTVTISGTGQGNITIPDILAALADQNRLLTSTSAIDQLYIHRIRAYGVTGGYLSMAPFPHRQYSAFYVTELSPLAQPGNFFNSYTVNSTNTSGSLTQMYEFAINGSTRPELTWEYANDEVTNNPFIISATLQDATDNTMFLSSTNTLACIVQSINTTGDATYFVQFDVTLRRSAFIPVATAFGAAAFGAENVPHDNYKRPDDTKKAIEEGEAAHELANKKRKVKIAKDLQLPVLDSH